jgi:hypothetical protein
VRIVTVVLVTVQTAVVDEVKATLSPELLIAVRVNGAAPTFVDESEAKVIVCEAVAKVNVRFELTTCE